MAYVLNVSIDQGTDSQFNINITDVSNNPVDLTNYDATAYFKKHANAYANTVVFMDTAGYANGLLEVSMTSGDTQLVQWGRYYYWVDIHHISSNTFTRVQEGILTIRP